MAGGSPHHHNGRTPARPPLSRFFLGAARESSQVWDHIKSCFPHSNLTHVCAEKPAQGDTWPLLLLWKLYHKYLAVSTNWCSGNSRNVENTLSYPVTLSWAFPVKMARLASAITLLSPEAQVVLRYYADVTECPS